MRVRRVIIYNIKERDSNETYRDSTLVWAGALGFKVWGLGLATFEQRSLPLP